MSQRAVGELLECYGIPQVPSSVRSRWPRRRRRGCRAWDAGGAQRGRCGAAAQARRRCGRGGARDSRGGARAPRTRSGDSVSKAGYELEGFQVQAMIEGGVELLVGVVQDESFGPVLACGAGGTQCRAGQGRGRADHAGDRSRCGGDVASPEAVSAAHRLPRGRVLVTSPRSQDVILRVSAMVEAHPEIVELDCNPLIACTRWRARRGRARARPRRRPDPAHAVSRALTALRSRAAARRLRTNRRVTPQSRRCGSRRVRSRTVPAERQGMSRVGRCQSRARAARRRR